MNKYFDEFWDDSSTQKCRRSRCKYCGVVKAKNTTRQHEHLQNCAPFLNTTEGQQSHADGSLAHIPSLATKSATASATKPPRDIWRGSAPNPALVLNRPHTTRTPRTSAAAPTPTPSLVSHLVTKHRALLDRSTQRPFLSHAGCGTLSTVVLQQWLAQQGHISRAFTTFVGGLIGKIRLPDTDTQASDSSYRTFDLLSSTMNNAKRELDFLTTTKHKYGLLVEKDLPTCVSLSMTPMLVLTC